MATVTAAQAQETRLTPRWTRLLHALCCAAGYNIRWLLRAIVRLGLGALFCALSAVVMCVASLLGALPAAPKAARAAVRPASVRSRAFTSMQLAAAV